jgi:hypothetical protein
MYTDASKVINIIIYNTLTILIFLMLLSMHEMIEIYNARPIDYDYVGIVNGAMC